MQNRIYVGAKRIAGERYLFEIFRYHTTPTESSHGGDYNWVIGPFRTLNGARVMVNYGFMNPNIQHVSDAEYWARHYEGVGGRPLGRLPERKIH